MAGQARGPLPQRVGDEERHVAAELLREHHAHGRLTVEEFTARIGAALTAQTTADIGELLYDLPVRRPDATERPLRPTPAPPRRAPLWLVRIGAGFAAATGLAFILGVLTGYGYGFSFYQFFYILPVAFVVMVAAEAAGWLAGQWRNGGADRPDQS